MFTNDHSPPHVHVFGQGGEAKIILDAPDGVAIEWVAGIGRADMRRVLVEARQERTRLLREWKKFMADEMDMAIVQAEGHGKQSLRSEPRARSARYDRKTGRVLVELTNGCSFAFPARRAEGLQEASDRDLVDIQILGLGYGLHWEKLDVDLSVPGLLAGLFGTKAYMDRMRAARAGAATSPAKAAAARKNGKKGGRPLKQAAKR
jgi:Protein of unknown function (DUF2442)/Domain of unknown function (DUF4160)